MLTTPTELKKRIPKGASIIFKRRKSDKIYYMAREKTTRKKRSTKSPLRKYSLHMEVEYNFLYKYNIVKEFFTKQKGITTDYLEMFFYLNNLTIFTTQDYKDIVFFGRKPVLKNLKKEGWIMRFNQQLKRPTPIYCMSKRAKIMVTEFHQLLLDERPITYGMSKKLAKDSKKGTKNDIIDKLIAVSEL
jgi:hypothetical protein